jgi:1-acyl-sn-glycerol-3-phosphate acyltransferase
VPAGPRLVDRLAAFVAHVFYRIDVVGEPPANGPLLLLPNHSNALLDPALVMATAGRPVRFLAKSTLFSGPFRPLLAAADAIPVYRRQDTAQTTRNTETFAAVQDALVAGEAVCVFPEGISHSSGRLEPLRTGAARMAVSAASAGADLRLVAVGINLEQKTTFRSRATIAYGVPFAIDAASPDVVKRLTEQIATHMRRLLVEADPRADAQLIERVNRLYRAGRDDEPAVDADLLRRKVIADAVHALRAERPEWYAAAILQLRRYDDRLRRFGLLDAALDWDVSAAAAWRFVAREIPLALVLLPVAAATVVIFAVPYALTSAAAGMIRHMDVTATAKVIAGGVLHSAWVASMGFFAWWFAGTPAAVLTMVGLPFLAIAGLFAVEREESAWRTARAWLALRGARRTTRTRLRRQRAELAGVMDEVNDWMSARAQQSHHIR